MVLRIASLLRTYFSKSKKLRANGRKCFKGVRLGHASIS
jgi:hypothetical protein